MRYAISYVSTANPNLPKEEVNDLLENATKSNNREGITGVLLCSETNFFQLIEGEEDKIKGLYSTIEKDPRHSNIIKFVEKPVSRPAYDGYTSELITNQTKYNSSTLNKFLHHVEVLDPKARKAVEKVILSMVL